MFIKKNNDPSELEKTINALHAEMTTVDGNSTQYASMADNLTKLYKLKEHEAPKRVSPDTLALVIGNLAGILIIVGHERVNVIGSKALNFVMKLK